MSRQFQHWCSINNVQHLRTSVNNPQCDGMAERFMRSIKNLIRADLIQRADWNQHTWVKGVQDSVRQYNSAVHKVTGVVPFELARGRTVVPRELSWFKPVSNLDNRQTRVIWNSVVKTGCERTGRIQSQRNTKNVAKLREFIPGQKVFRKNLQIRPGVSKSLAPRWDGPFEILRRIGESTYVIRNPENQNFTQIIHVNKLVLADAEDVQYLPRRRGRPSLRRGEV
jgi:hypothetical protein